MKVLKPAAIGAMLVAGSLGIYAQDSPKAPAVKDPAPADLKDSSVKQRASYALGLKMARDFKAQSIDLDADLLAKGLKDGLSGGKASLTDAEILECLQAFQEEMAAKQASKPPPGTDMALAEKNKKEGDAFLAANAKKPGVKKLPSGLQYKVIKEGTGRIPIATDTVTTNYRGTLIDGTEFDSSYKRGEPASFQVNKVIKGWTEALQLMKVGSKWQLFIPAELAYRLRPRPGGPIGPNATLVFDIELLGIE